MYYRILEEGKILKTWKRATITTLQLQTSSPNKNTLHEKITNKRLVCYMEKEKKIDERQFGLRKQRSIIDAILRKLATERRHFNN